MKNSLHANGYVIPGDNIEGNLSFKNKQKFNVVLRTKILVETPNFYEGSDHFESLFKLEFMQGWIKKGSWYYYKGVLEPKTELTNIISHFTIKDNIGRSYGGKKFKISVVCGILEATNKAVLENWIESGELTEEDRTELEYIF